MLKYFQKCEGPCPLLENPMFSMYAYAVFLGNTIQLPFFVCNGFLYFCIFDRMEDKGQVISIKFSPDLKILAIQRSQRSVVSFQSTFKLAKSYKIQVGSREFTSSITVLPNLLNLTESRFYNNCYLGLFLLVL